MHYYIQKGISLEELKKANYIDVAFYKASMLTMYEIMEERG